MVIIYDFIMPSICFLFFFKCLLPSLCVIVHVFFPLVYIRIQSIFLLTHCLHFPIFLSFSFFISFTIYSFILLSYHFLFVSCSLAFLILFVFIITTLLWCILWSWNLGQMDASLFFILVALYLWHKTTNGGNIL